MEARLVGRYAERARDVGGAQGTGRAELVEDPVADGVCDRADIRAVVHHRGGPWVMGDTLPGSRTDYCARTVRKDRAGMTRYRGSRATTTSPCSGVGHDSELGSQMSMFVFPLLTYHLTGSTSWPPRPGGPPARDLPAALLPAGVLADRMDRRRLMRRPARPAYSSTCRRRGRVGRCADDAAPARRRGAHRRVRGSVRTRRDVGRALGRTDRRAADGALAEPGAPARRVAGGRPLGGRCTP